MVKGATIPVVVLMAALSAAAQNRLAMGGCGAGCAKPGMMVPGANTGRISISGRPFRGRTFHGSHARNGYSGAWPYWGWGSYDGIDYGDSIEPQGGEPAPREIIPERKQEPLPEPELLELQGNQWVRVTTFKTAISETEPHPVTPKPLSPAVLIFRDGHREEIDSYSIIGAILYTKGDYWTTGSWTRSIQVSDLNLTATLKENHARGLSFDLPSGPSEVIIRP
ncbi:MAG: hypothetical protein JO356_04230 [Acidobacteria bacterium]|nr:hypothetical protein [Acidobacteriota bacterium]